VSGNKINCVGKLYRYVNPHVTQMPLRKIMVEMLKCRRSFFFETSDAVLLLADLCLFYQYVHDDYGN